MRGSNSPSPKPSLSRRWARLIVAAHRSPSTCQRSARMRAADRPKCSTGGRRGVPPTAGTSRVWLSGSSGCLTTDLVGADLMRWMLRCRQYECACSSGCECSVDQLRLGFLSRVTCTICALSSWLIVVSVLRSHLGTKVDSRRFGDETNQAGDRCWSWLLLWDASRPVSATTI